MSRVSPLPFGRPSFGRRWASRLVALVSATVVIVGGGALLAPLASQASTPGCSMSVSRTIYQGNYTTHIPAGFGSSGTTFVACYMVIGFSDGSSGSAVSTLQYNLNACYGYSLTRDGVFGTKTQAALMAVQKKLGINVDGIYGEQTRKAMNWIFSYTSTGKVFGCRKL